MTALTKSNYKLKTVKFNNVNMIAIKTEDGKIFTSIKKICEDLGIDPESQAKRIKRDEILSKGAVIMSVPSNGGTQQTLCLNIESLPFWLTGIQSNKCKEEVRDSLIEFKIKAQKMLSDAFIQSQPVTEKQLPQNYLEALKHLVQAEETKLLLEAKIEQDKPKVQAYDSFLSSTTALDFSTVSKALKMGRNKLFEFCRQKELLKYNNEPYQKYVDSGLFEVIIVNKYNDSDFNQNFSKTLITPKGQEKIRMLLQEDN